MAEKLDKAEAVAVGIGGAGGIISAELAKEGAQVVGLERGQDRSTEDFQLVDEQDRCPIRNELIHDLSKETTKFRHNSDETALPVRQFGGFLIGDGVGGAGTHWNGDTWFFSPYDFEIKTNTEEKYGKNKI